MHQDIHVYRMNIMNNKIVIGIIGLVLIAAGFYGGITYAKNKGPVRSGQFVQFGAGGGRGLRGMGGFNGGEIISKDATGITIKSPDGSTKIVLIASSTEVMKTVTGSINDLSIGENITAMGQTNSDGSLTASSIQIRPAGMFFASTTPRR